MAADERPLFSLSCSEITFAHEQAAQVVDLTNLSGVEAAFKVRMTHVGHTTSKPARGVVPAGGTTRFEVSLKGDLQELQDEASVRMMVQCSDASGVVLWKQRLALNLPFLNGVGGGAGAPAAATRLAVDTGSDMTNPSPSPSPTFVSPHAGGGAFTIRADLASLQAPLPLPAPAYSVQWKRGTVTGTTSAVAPANNVIPFNQAIVIPRCTASFKDGKALKKYLTFAVVGSDGAQVGQVKILASEFDPGPKGAEIPVALTIAGQACQGTIGITITMTQDVAAAWPAEGARGASPPGVAPPGRPAAAATPPSAAAVAPAAAAAVPAALPERTGGRKFVELPGATAVGATGGAGSPTAELEQYNPLDTGLPTTRDVPLDQNIQVLVRVRPGDAPVWQTDVPNATVRDDEKSHVFDHVIPMAAQNTEVWDLVGPRFIDAVTTGVNGTIFMYGQTGSGKTHTMFGKPNEPGLTAMLFEKLFERIRLLEQANTTYTVQASYFEIYNEQLNDLLVSDYRKGRDLRIRQKPDGSFTVPDLVVQRVTDMDACKRLLELGGSKKMMGYSHLNVESSRSHTIFSIQVVSESAGGGKTVKKTATLNFCDLAGSESLNTEGDMGQKKETVNINRSLTYLKNVIKQLAEHDRHVSYRNSSLTRILKQSLGGNAKTSVIITIHPGREQQKDSRNSLWFGSMARTVKNRARVNAEVDEGNLRAMIKRLQGEIAARDAELECLHEMRDDYLKLRDEYTGLLDENEMLRNNASAASVEQAVDKRLGIAAADPPPAPQGTAPQAYASSGPAVVVDREREERFLARESALLKQINDKDREIIDLKLAHSRELMEKTRQLQRALQEQEQEETALELMQKDDRLDQLVHQILSYLHYGTKVLLVNNAKSSGSSRAPPATTRVLLYLVTQDGTQHICVSPLDANAKGVKDNIIEKISVRDVKRTILGQYGSAFEKTRNRELAAQFDQSFSIVGRKGKRLDVVAETPSDFEAWIQSLNHLTMLKAEWGDTMDITDMEESEKLDAEEKNLCSLMHIPPIDYLNARSQVLNKEGRFVTLFDVRTLSCLDMYHSQKLFAFFMSKGWIGQRKLFFLDTAAISKSNLYVVEYESDDNTSSVPPPAPAHHLQQAGGGAYPRPGVVPPQGAVKGPPNPGTPPPSYAPTYG